MADPLDLCTMTTTCKVTEGRPGLQAALCSTLSEAEDGSKPWWLVMDGSLDMDPGFMTAVFNVSGLRYLM